VYALRPLVSVLTAMTESANLERRKKDVNFDERANFKEETLDSRYINCR
jgi:hypothetical protein